MKYLVGFFVAVVITIGAVQIFSGSGSASIGDGEKAWAKACGKGEVVSLNAPHHKSVRFKQGISQSVTVSFVDGVAKQVAYAGLSKGKIDRYLAANAQGRSWKLTKLNSYGDESRDWTRDDGAKAHYGTYPVNQLTIEAP